MQKLKPMSSPDVYNFQDPDTGFSFLAPSKKALIAHIVAYREQNQLSPIEFLDVVLENYWCSQPGNSGNCEPVMLRRGILQTLKGGVALLKHVFTGQYVGRAEADRRGSICVVCPLNEFPDKTAFVTWSDNLAHELTGNRQSEHHNELGNCIGCGCPLRVKVHSVPPFKLKNEEADKMRAARKDCWQLAENEQKDRVDANE